MTALTEKKKNTLYFLVSVVLILLPFLYLVISYCRVPYFSDFGAYCAISRALFEGHNPFPDHHEFLFCHTHGGDIVPIVYPGQMLFFVIPSYLWGDAIQILYPFLNIVIVFFLLGFTLVKACGYQVRDLWTPGKRMFIYAICCFFCCLSSPTKEAVKWGQIPIILALCFYCMFWVGGRTAFAFWLRTFFFAFIAVAKYSLLPVVAPLLFFKGHWKLCIAGFSVFVFLSISPVFCGNDLVDVYTEYIKALSLVVQPGHINHYGAFPNGMCHLGFFKISIINHLLKAVVVGVILWLFWRERKKKYLSDTLLLLSFSLTMLLSYHRVYDMVFIFPLFMIRIIDFYEKKQWKLFWITGMFPFLLIVPRSIGCNLIPSYFGRIPGMDSLVYLTDYPPYQHIFPIMPIFTIALTLWSLYLYLHVENPYRFELPIPGKKDSEEPEGSEEPGK